MINKLAVYGYRSLRNIEVSLEPLTIITGANGSGKTNLYRALRLLAEIAQGRLISTLAAEGGLHSTLWAGPESFSKGMIDGKQPVQGTVRKFPVSLRLGFSSDAYSYAIDLGLPSSENPFPLDPAIKLETMWLNGQLRNSSIIAERRAAHVKLRTVGSHGWNDIETNLSSFDSMITHCADPIDGAELLSMRERIRDWRFYDSLRTDPLAPARTKQVMTYTPVLASDGADLAAAIATICAIGDASGLEEAIDNAFPGSTIIAETDNKYGDIHLHQKGLLRPLGAAELSDGTLRYIMLAAALLSPRPPELMVLNEPEASLHPSLMPALANLIVTASQHGQIIVVSHNDALIKSILSSGEANEIRLEKRLGETINPNVKFSSWDWPIR